MHVEMFNRTEMANIICHQSALNGIWKNSLNRIVRYLLDYNKTEPMCEHRDRFKNCLLNGVKGIEEKQKSGIISSACIQCGYSKRCWESFSPKMEKKKKKTNRVYSPVWIIS